MDAELLGLAKASSIDQPRDLIERGAGEGTNREDGERVMWVKGDSGVKGNEEADAMARRERLETGGLYRETSQA
ncbi:hypothetical protein BGX38DRAFT_1271422 [Terfezia claveryi]|nr:hypothetical protein BGX38DRAFT_1271422 [Terfezia claveryi]